MSWKKQTYYGDQTFADVIEKLLRIMGDRRTGAFIVTLVEGRVDCIETELDAE